MATKTAPPKRGPGRPKKTAVTETPVKRGPGRPKKVVTEEAPAKRGPGRPRKNPEAVPLSDTVAKKAPVKKADPLTTESRAGRIERAMGSSDIEEMSGLPFPVQQAIITLHRFVRFGVDDQFTRVSESLSD